MRLVGVLPLLGRHPSVVSVLIVDSTNVVVVGVIIVVDVVLVVKRVVGETVLVVVGCLLKPVVLVICRALVAPVVLEDCKGRPGREDTCGCSENEPNEDVFELKIPEVEEEPEDDAEREETVEEDVSPNFGSSPACGALSPARSTAPKATKMLEHNITTYHVRCLIGVCVFHQSKSHFFTIS